MPPRRERMCAASSVRAAQALSARLDGRADVIISPERIAQIERRHADLAAQMGNPDLSADKFVQLSKDYAELTPVVEPPPRLCGRFATKRERLAAIPSRRRNARDGAGRTARHRRRSCPLAERALALKLLPTDKADAKPAMLEIRAGTGGDEAALFAGDLYRMYERYAATRGWRVELISASRRRNGRVQGNHCQRDGRQRVRAAEVRKRRPPRAARAGDRNAGGRIHTSAATVAVLPEAEEVDIQIEDKDLRIDVFRSSRPGRPVGQHHRQRGAHHPYADRAGGAAAGRKIAAQEQGQGDEGAALAAVRPGAQRRSTRRGRRTARRWSARATARNASAPIISRKAG